MTVFKTLGKKGDGDVVGFFEGQKMKGVAGAPDIITTSGDVPSSVAEIDGAAGGIWALARKIVDILGEHKIFKRSQQEVIRRHSIKLTSNINRPLGRCCY